MKLKTFNEEPNLRIILDFILKIFENFQEIKNLNHAKDFIYFL